MARIARGSVTLFDIADGDTGLGGARNAIIYLFRETTDDTVPAAPSASITWATGAISTITAGWSTEPPTVDATGTNRPWVSTVVFFQASSASQSALTAGTGSTPKKGFVFDGVVTFTNAGDNGGIEASDGTTTRTLVTPNSLGTNGTTVINGGRIDTGTLNADRITTDTLTLGQVANQSDAGGSIEFTNNLISIKDAAGNVRIKIGKLS